MRWSSADGQPFATTLEVHAQDRDGLLLDIAAALTSLQLRIREITGRDLPDARCQFTVTFEVRDLSQLAAVSNRIRAIPNVYSVRRGHS